jgi:hypothetical protein
VIADYSEVSIPDSCESRHNVVEIRGNSGRLAFGHRARLAEPQGQIAIIIVVKVSARYEYQGKNLDYSLSDDLFHRGSARTTDSRLYR